MAQFTFGPVELYLVGLENDRPSPEVLAALGDLLDAGVIRLLDFMIISKGEDGDVLVTEIENEEHTYGLGGIELEAVGIAGEDDIAEFAELIPPGTAAALVVMELLWAKTLGQRLASSGAEVLSVERIPAPVVNGLVDALNGSTTE